MQQINNWDSYRRMWVNIQKAIPNEVVTQLLTRHYRYLHSLLVKQLTDEDIFNDTYLKLTYNYNPDKDFIDQFKYYFNLLKGAYYRDNKATNWLVTYIEDNPVEIADSISDEQPVNKKDDFINNLKSDLNAISKKANKTTKTAH